METVCNECVRGLGGKDGLVVRSSKGDFMELLTGLIPLGLLVIFAVYLVSRGSRVKADGTKNAESHSSSIAED